jgi:signal transduction histidine kinase
MYAAEFGDPIEVPLRLFLICSGAVIYEFHSGNGLGPIWLLAYLVLEALAFALSFRAPAQPSRRHRRLGMAAYYAATMSFASLPLFLLATGDAAESFAAAMALSMLCVFNLWRDDPPAAVLPLDMAIGWLFAGTVALFHVPPTGALLSDVLLHLLLLGAVSYYSMALVSTRRTLRKLREAAARRQEARKMEALGRLSGGIAHDFNNILTVLQGSLELYEEVCDADERRRLVQEAHGSALRASALVRQLLSFARRAPLTPQRIEADDVVETLGAMAERLLPAGIAVRVDPPAVRLPILADGDGLSSALLNLLINARDAIGERGTIYLAAAPLRQVAPGDPLPGLAPGSYVAFSVTDDGPGMTPEIAAQALEPFFTTKPIGAGSGLGLPSAKGFAEQSGGGLIIDSRPGRTRVTLCVPLAPAGDPTPATAADAPPLGARHTGPGAIP